MIEKFSFKIKKVFASEGYMLVTYSALGYTDVDVGVPLPTVEQSDEELITAHAPHAAWALADQKKLERRIPEVGTRGVIALPETLKLEP